VKETKQKAIDENKKNAEKNGSAITQDIDAEGNLIGISTQEKALTTGNEGENVDTISVADIRSELFDGDNVVVGKSDYGRSELVSGPFAST
jgi:hypothetical protein